MKVTLKIQRIFDKRGGQNPHTGKYWTNQELLCSWEEETENSVIEHSAICTSWQDLNPIALDDARRNMEKIEARVSFGTREYNGRWFTDIKMWLPRRFEIGKESAPAPKPITPQQQTTIPQPAKDNRPDGALEAAAESAQAAEKEGDLPF